MPDRLPIIVIPLIFLMASHGLFIREAMFERSIYNPPIQPVLLFLSLCYTYKGILICGLMELYFCQRRKHCTM